MNYIYRSIMMTLVLALVPFMGISAKKKVAQQSDRQYWCALAYKMAQPVLENMAKGELQKNMQTEFSPSFDNRNKKVLYMECFGRLMAGVAPWLTLPDDATAEGKQRKQLREWALASYKNAVDPQNPDYLCWGIGGQNLVDAAYIAESFLRAYDTLWKPLDEVTKKRYLAEFAKLRHIDPPYTNWLLFSSTIESFMAKAGGDFDEYRVNSACRKVEEWYVGDGWYADGPVFAFDYYSSYVFHPMYLETLQAMVDAKVNSRLDYQKYYDRELKRCQKYSIILERFISPEGTFPAFGRSIPYRMATMQPLALMAWYQKLPKDLSNGQVRAALTKVLHRMFDQENNFNEKGYLSIGFCGNGQKNVADWYTNNGSLYMTTLAFMPLGLPADHPFWTDAAQPWTQVKAWNNQQFPKDHQWKDDIVTKDKW
ncbi:DUF2264 domain-containing protein [Segatella copri]|uniref:DUF2264 domain-containing protein n=1 Tax=Segatella copri TaxID=165179 RepID=A0AAW4N5M6_9BACT|nr:DUF2264 domain-containing protein [Segatella copri]MBU9910337.1 DUF2264 domain-containing protein [Segatella copri]MBV3397919.1 DUF2264 domain-containing protein [Segatella copri]MBV3407569.1 DUF2264 domain-containing protein [Segatella copri]MBV3410783.1 DUF2264 domain-containing protein [Segatella copri]MBV3419216.1 DUF2264 domain-containing protein [Segatella copri]